ncbi:ATP-dependent helicase [Haloprofundus marisrubri]|uniref:ATP-dependent helicase n=1 Tax=Haloprofundus marisrubri TaxID=1514971 RepID=A0A0W1RD76_9EURY|nr:DEAD/DEAH box helicase [Haloprofundus marisrubri]KTG11399.1 ATP-dependent helicase [Haloprofundus marisrubri]
MTKLNQVEGIENAREFVNNELVEQKGPYVEFVDAPKFHDQSAIDFLGDLGYDERITDAIVQELFGGNESGSLYQHQAEMVEQIETNDDDNILAVPTATGKTESFFLPILNHCLSTDEDGLKSLILYPMKTLGVDQLNRFITYLDQINRNLDPEDRITIGIWDSDTPTRVGTRGYEIEKGSYVRGLQCPRNGEKLRVLGESTVGTDDNKYSWIRVTRDSIRRGVDIMLTNPEALDYMFVSNNDESRGVLGDTPSEHPVKHIVFDEAHVWSGIQGAAVQLLSRRLKHFYKNRNPQITMVSATVENPGPLAKSLTGTNTDNINVVEFTARDFDLRSEASFTRLTPTTLSDLVHSIALAYVSADNSEEVIETYALQNAIKTLEEVGFFSDGQSLTLAPNTEWATQPIERRLDSLLLHDFSSVEEVVASESGRSKLTESVIEQSGTMSGWYEFVLNHVPEVAQFAEWFNTDTVGEVEFREYDQLLELAKDTGVEDAEGTLETVMAFGRLAGVVTEKYHVFLKPPTNVYWCRDCDRVMRDSWCCGSHNPEVQFCRRCHHPHVEILESEDDSFIPIGGETSSSSVCPGCDKRPRLSDIGVPTSSLLSYMLTEICRNSPSKKTLVFSDSHSSAESVGDRIINTEYGLMAETLYIQELIKAGGSKDNYELYRAVSDTLRDEYWQPLMQNEIDEDGSAYNVLRTLLEDIGAHAMLSNCSHLIDSALVTADVIAEIEDPAELVAAHRLYELFALRQRDEFSSKGVSFDGLTREKIIERLGTRLSLSYEELDAFVETYLPLFLEKGIITEMQWDEVQQSIESARIGEESRSQVRQMLEQAREDISHIPGYESPESGVFKRAPRQDESNLTLVRQAAFCSDCYESVPATENGQAISTCPDCGGSLKIYERFTHNEEGELEVEPGYAEVTAGWDWSVDHWAHDITTPIRGGKSPEFITVGIHKGNIPHTLRGAIEEGFRKDDPDVNIVSATPTMELGVDIGTLDTVAQVGIPPTLTNYVQRSGRTGRTRGSSSLVMTVVRGNHPVDGHYYSHLDSYLDEFEPVRVPDPEDFGELLAGHVVTEVFAYLARNPHESNVFNRMYELPSPKKENLKSYVNGVQEHLDILREFILMEMQDTITDHLKSVFGPRGSEVFEEVFIGDGPLSLEHRTDQTFSQLATMSGDAETNKSLTETNSRLDQWLARLGYLANYRNFGQQFPVRFTGRREGIEFEASGRLYDMYPGEGNDLGAMVSLHGTKYLVSDVRGTATPLTTVAVCDNEECDRPFESYGEDVELCPYCDTELAVTDVHGISSVECKTAVGGQRGYRTHGLMSTHVKNTETTATKESFETELFGVSCDVEYGELEVTDFVYAFERGHSRSPDKKTLHSEALIEQESDDSISASGSWLDRLNEAEEEVYRPVGQRYHTQGLSLNFSVDELQSRLEKVDHDTVSWTQALVSLQQALEKAIAVVAECDRADFRVKTEKTDETVSVYIVDSRQGGNGITWQVRENLEHRIPKEVVSIANCSRCGDYCDECLLLSRTPAHYLENDLLNHRTLESILGVAGK